MATPDAARFFISNLITPPNVLLRLTGTRRDDILRELVARIAELAGRPEARDTLLKALIEREHLHSTGIGDGIALPHARQALAGLVEKPMIVFGRHPEGIAYDAIDRQPARLFFLLISTTVTEHLQILARISRLVRDAKLREKLLHADKPEAVLDLIRETETRV